VLVGSGVLVAVGVGVSVAVGVGVKVAVAVGVKVAVEVAVAVGVDEITSSLIDCANWQPEREKARMAANKIKRNALFFIQK
jgi:hypothetical protein